MDEPQGSLSGSALAVVAWLGNCLISAPGSTESFDKLRFESEYGFVASQATCRKVAYHTSVC